MVSYWLKHLYFDRTHRDYPVLADTLWPWWLLVPSAATQDAVHQSTHDRQCGQVDEGLATMRIHSVKAVDLDFGRLAPWRKSDFQHDHPSRPSVVTNGSAAK